MTYEEIKAKAIELKPKFVLLVCFALVFLIGFGTGRYSQTEADPKGSSLQADYNTDKPVIEAETGDKQADVKGANIEAPDQQGQAGQGCIVKGNISAKGAKIYHVAGGAFYNLTKPEQCFQTEEEARAAGFKKSSR